MMGLRIVFYSHDCGDVDKPTYAAKNFLSDRFDFQSIS